MHVKTSAVKTSMAEARAEQAHTHEAGGIKRCGWCGDDPLYVRYHDEEWGREAKDDRALFEFLLLEGAQAGLSWYAVLKRREGYRRLFEGFDPERVARLGAGDVVRILEDPGIIRNRQKVEAAVSNARCFLQVQQEFGAFGAYLRSFLPGGGPVVNHWEALGEVPASAPFAEAMSRDMKKRGFKFCGPTICYAYLQATGFVDDHLVGCAFRPHRP
ncbi:MAG: DNA-3-methyladenine glycosylase I [Coriobacteriales bacterium]|jgi:DNA-3-methyladenine glycosylase I|nr:DNA-3-methyladenine glycosylase I [Coriobacteriales bacterium]